MATAFASAVLATSAENVWRSVRDFNGLPDWHPGIKSSEIEDGRPAGEVGCIRRLTLGDGTVIRERLCVLDDSDRSYGYEFVESPFAVRSYFATIRVHPVTATGEAFVEWFARYDAENADEPSLEELFRDTVFAPGLQALALYLGQ